MSDRRQIFNIETGHGGERVVLYMDGESGTWRLFYEPGDYQRGNVDFSLAGLRQLRDSITSALEQIEANPDGFNAEVRRTWND